MTTINREFIEKRVAERLEEIKDSKETAPIFIESAGKIQLDKLAMHLFEEFYRMVPKKGITPDLGELNSMLYSLKKAPVEVRLLTMKVLEAENYFLVEGAEKVKERLNDFIDLLVDAANEYGAGEKEVQLASKGLNEYLDRIFESKQVDYAQASDKLLELKKWGAFETKTGKEFDLTLLETLISFKEMDPDEVKKNAPKYKSRGEMAKAGDCEALKAALTDFEKNNQLKEVKGELEILAWIACKHGKLEMVQMLVNDYKVEFKEYDESNGMTPFLAAIESNNGALVSYMAGLNKDFLTQGDFRMRKVLHIAVEADADNSIQALADLGCPLDERDFEGHTLLHLAAIGGEREVSMIKALEKLMELGVDPTIRDYQIDEDGNGAFADNYITVLEEDDDATKFAKPEDLDKIYNKLKNYREDWENGKIGPAKSNGQGGAIKSMFGF